MVFNLLWLMPLGTHGIPPNTHSPQTWNLWTPLAQNDYWANSMKPWDPTRNLLYITLWPRGLFGRIGPFGRFSGWYLEQWTPKKQNSSQSSRKKFNIRELKASIWQKRKKKLNLRMFVRKLNSYYKVTYFSPLLSFFVKIYQVILNPK